MAGDPTVKPAEPARWTKIVITDAAGEPISETNPLFVTWTLAERAALAQRAETDALVLIELRVISRLLSIGLNVSDEIDQLRADELAGVGSF